MNVDVMPSRDLEAELARCVGDDAVIRDPALKERFVTEERGLFRGDPAAIVVPGSVEETSRVLSFCHQRGIAVVTQGGNTGLCGGAVAGLRDREVLLSTSRLKGKTAIEPVEQTGLFPAGLTLVEVKDAARSKGLDLPLSYGSEGTATIGGALATNAGGMDAIRYGTARDLVRGVKVVLPDGRVLDLLRGLQKDNTGFDLKNLFVGSEGTLGVIVAAKMELVPLISNRITAAVSVASIDEAITLLQSARAAFGPALLRMECISHAAVEITLAQVAGLRPLFEDNAAWTLAVEIGDASADLGQAVEAWLTDAFEEGLVADGVIAQSQAQAADIWRLRESVIEAQKRDGASIKHDIAVPVACLPEFLSAAGDIVQSITPGARPVPFGHLGDGNIHYNVQQPSGSRDAGFLERWDAIADAIHELTVSLGGSFSAEHGIGVLKVRDLERFAAPVELDVMRAVKRAIDPNGIMNPGKVLAADRSAP